MDSHLDSQNFIGYRSTYESYKFLMDSHLDLSESDPLTTLHVHCCLLIGRRKAQGIGRFGTRY
jgi:hypothetical protein